MSAKLYEPCTACDANGKLHGVNQFGISVEVDCSCRGTKFQEIGLTVNQLERLTRKSDGLDRIARLVKPLDLVELGIAAGRLKDTGDGQGNESFAWSGDEVFAAQSAIAGILVVLEDVSGPLGGRRK